MKAITLMYHDICDDPGTSGFGGHDAAIYKLSVARFTRHLDAMAEEAGVVAGRVDEWDFGQLSKPFFLTFDDGGVSALTAAGLLDERGWKGHFMITTAKIGTPGFVTAADIAELDRMGHIVGSHSDSHPLRMAALSRAEVNEEWQISKDKLGSIVGKPIETASVPGGYFSRIVAETAAENGTKFLFNSEPVQTVKEVGGCRIFGRYTIRQKCDASTVAELASGNFSAGFRQSLLWNAKKPLKILGGERFLRLRRRLISEIGTRGDV